MVKYFEVLPIELNSPINDTQCIVPPNKNPHKRKRSEEIESQREERLKKARDYEKRKI